MGHSLFFSLLLTSPPVVSDIYSPESQRLFHEATLRRGRSWRWISRWPLWAGGCRVLDPHPVSGNLSFHSGSRAWILWTISSYSVHFLSLWKRFGLQSLATRTHSDRHLQMLSTSCDWPRDPWCHQPGPWRVRWRWLMSSLYRYNSNEGLCTEKYYHVSLYYFSSMSHHKEWVQLSEHLYII